MEFISHKCDKVQTNDYTSGGFKGEEWGRLLLGSKNFVSCFSRLKMRKFNTIKP